ncbi:hypothetical protein DJ73_05790 [Halorubrum sp. Ea1]|uniref:hypothetical protein n=1 Tax=Halorubrum sp. Ea1 TaxID=1480718 RepID=UPI000B999DB0|nr:hypothetical protein [Halorubrum sp. Ea1]OYR54155.1 hypothetical protein DJ73_05790 [Halorubrum sp. Ea1]
MKDKEGKNHPHLLMLDEFDGEMDGELKYHKVLYKYRVNALEKEDWGFTRDRWGPTDPGFTEIMQSLDDLDLAELDEDDRMHIVRMTNGGKEVADGLKRGLSKLDPGFSPRIQTILGIAESDKDRPGSEIVEDEIIQEAKEETEESQV